jgi:hypothetical protein
MQGYSGMARLDMLGQVCTVYVRLCHVRTGYVRLVQVSTFYVRLGLVRRG